MPHTLNDFEAHRMRRTLSQVMQKLEEALRLSRVRDRKLGPQSPNDSKG